MEQLVVVVCKLESTICCCCDQLLSPGPHYAKGEEVVVDSEEGDNEEEHNLEYETEVETLDPSYTTPPSTRGCSEPSSHPSHSPSPGGSDPENNAALRTLMIEAQVEAFLAEADKDLELHDLLPLENVSPIPIQMTIIPGFVPFAMSTSQQCIPSKGLPHALHPYKNSVG